jgi:hypothetical protein
VQNNSTNTETKNPVQNLEENLVKDLVYFENLEVDEYTMEEIEQVYQKVYILIKMAQKGT